MLCFLAPICSPVFRWELTHPLPPLSPPQKMLRAQKTPEAKLESFKLKRGDQATICTIIVPRQNVDCCDTLRHVADARGSVRRIVLKVV